MLSNNNILAITELDHTSLTTEPVPASTIACDFEPGNICGYSDISLHNIAKWECIDISGDLY